MESSFDVLGFLRTSEGFTRFGLLLTIVYICTFLIAYECRWISHSVYSSLQDYSQLPKADLFALGLTIVVAAGTGPLPCNDDSWHYIRKGNLPDIPQSLSSAFYDLLKVQILNNAHFLGIICGCLLYTYAISVTEL